jgi:hypothetical protein
MTLTWETAEDLGTGPGCVDEHADHDFSVLPVLVLAEVAEVGAESSAGLTELLTECLGCDAET